MGRAGGSVAVLRPIATGSLAGNVPTRARSRRASRAAAPGPRVRAWAGAPALARVRVVRLAAGMLAVSEGTRALQPAHTQSCSGVGVGNPGEFRANLRHLRATASGARWTSRGLSARVD